MSSKQYLLEQVQYPACSGSRPSLPETSWSSDGRTWLWCRHRSARALSFGRLQFRKFRRRRRETWSLKSHYKAQTEKNDIKLNTFSIKINLEAWIFIIVFWSSLTQICTGFVSWACHPCRPWRIASDLGEDEVPGVEVLGRCLHRDDPEFCSNENISNNFEFFLLFDEIF